LIGFVVVFFCPRITITPQLHSSGKFDVEVILIDVPTYDDILPAQSTAKITIDIKPLQDAPTIHMFTPNGFYMLQPDPAIPVVVSSRSFSPCLSILVLPVMSIGIFSE